MINNQLAIRGLVAKSCFNRMERKRYQFEKLEVWQQSKLLNTKLYTLTKKFPSNVDFALKSQIQRASVSICANIAEGTGRRKGRDQGQFYKIAYSSTIEILNNLLLCIDNKLVDENYFLIELNPLIERITRQLNALYKFSMNADNGIPQ